MTHRALLAQTTKARLTLVMVSRSALAGLLMLALGSASEVAVAQHDPLPTPAKPAIQSATPATATAPHKARKATKQKAKKEEEQPVEPVVQTPPPDPPTPEQSPAAAPQVNYQDGQLSIRSDNSTLGSILSAVKARTGATIDGPGVSSSERVATQLGPGDPRDVLSTLLSSTKYDFMLVGAAGNPKSVQKIILTARASGGSTAAAANQPRASQAFQAPTEQPDPDQSLPDAEIPDEQPVIEEPPQPEPETQQQEQQPPQQVPNGIPIQQQPNPDAADQPPQQQNPNQPKSPEQLLQELQRMQQQQQQQQRPEDPH